MSNFYANGQPRPVTGGSTREIPITLTQYMASEPTTHSHEASYRHAIGSTGGIEVGTCRCGTAVWRPAPYGVAPCDNRHVWTVRDMDAAYAEASDENATRGVAMDEAAMLGQLDRNHTGAFLNGVLIIAEPDNDWEIEQELAEHVRTVHPAMTNIRLKWRIVGGEGRVALDFRS